jgi:hypothetical protein
MNWSKIISKAKLYIRNVSRIQNYGIGFVFAEGEEGWYGKYPTSASFFGARRAKLE